MAGEAAIAGVIAQALVYCRRYDRHETEAAVRLWTSIFRDTPSEDLLEAVHHWAAHLDEDTIRNKAQTLPMPGALQRIMAKGPDRPPDRTPQPNWATADREYAHAHLATQRQIRALAGSPLTTIDSIIEHDHTTPTFDDNGQLVTKGNENCAACRNPQPVDKRDQIRALLDDLPQPTPVSYPCRCDGSMFIDTEEALDSLVSLEWGERPVIPCPRCNREAFERYSSGAYEPVRH